VYVCMCKVGVSTLDIDQLMMFSVMNKYGMKTDNEYIHI
jgi:hypothetical protein